MDVKVCARTSLCRSAQHFTRAHKPGPLARESILDISLFFSCFQIAQFDLTPSVTTKQLLILPCFTGALCVRGLRSGAAGPADREERPIGYLAIRRCVLNLDGKRRLADRPD